ncbi:MAG TPA: ABC transporter ATP-binding protein [Acetobacteraceae bacterium]|jgi:branched-chain amino acid transport system ATP-binding protein|nr:ABC transporter ATP-binding protein [Acetobacteraceae bacterium]
MSDGYALETVGLNRSFGSLHVTRDVNFRLPYGARHALIGPNGAGKSTLINLLTGILPPSSGSVKLDGADVTQVPAERRVRRGLVRTFQINTLFADLTPLESVVMAVSERDGIGFNPVRSLSGCRSAIAESAALLERLGFGADARRRTRELPYGRQRLLEIALALSLNPKVLLLDEPAAGVPTGESTEIFEVIAALPSDVAVLFIEHDMELVARFAQHVTVLVAGEIMTEGTPAEIGAHPGVREVYLGEHVHA